MMSTRAIILDVVLELVVADTQAVSTIKPVVNLLVLVVAVAHMPLVFI